MGLLDFIVKHAQAYVARRAPGDPTVFNDPEALNTEWTPVKRGGAKFKTHFLSEGDGGKLSFKASVGSIAYGVAFVLAGVGVMGKFLSAGSPLAVIGAPLAIAGIVMLVGGRKKEFDPEARVAVIGRQTIPFANISAVQIVRELVEKKEGSDYFSYELNLVLTDASRINVIDHGKLDSVRGDAARISACLGCKLWDATLSQSG